MSSCLPFSAQKFNAFDSVLILLTFSRVSFLRFWAADWPQFLGPTRNGVYAGTDLAKTWPTEGPPVVWQKKVGAGFSGPAVSGPVAGSFSSFG